MVVENDFNIFFEIFFVLFFVLTNAFFVAVEFSLVKIRPSRINQLVQEGGFRAKLVKNVLPNIDAFLSSCQLGITLSSILLGWRLSFYTNELITYLSTALNLGAPSSGIWTIIAYILAFGCIVAIHMVIGELIPKTIALQKTESIVLWLTPILFVFNRLVAPFIWGIHLLNRILLKLFGFHRNIGSVQAHTEEEIRLLVNESEKSGMIDHDERRLFDSVFEFSDRVARESMLPRTEMTVLYIEDSFEEIQEMILETKHTRYPVAEDDKDNIIGFIHISDFYAESVKPKDRCIQNILRKILTIPEFMELSQTLQLMKKNRTHIAVVLDEYGGTAGLLTLEDIIEELIGEIQDEFDNERPIYEETKDGYSIDGRMLIQDFNNMLSADIPNDDVDTLGGFVQMMLDSELEIGKVVLYKNFIFEVDEILKNIIVRLNVQIQASPEEDVG